MITIVSPVLSFVDKNQFIQNIRGDDMFWLTKGRITEKSGPRYLRCLLSSLKLDEKVKRRSVKLYNSS